MKWNAPTETREGLLLCRMDPESILITGLILRYAEFSHSLPCDRPPATHYHLVDQGGFYAEFRSPLVGSEYGQRGERKATREVPPSASSGSILARALFLPTAPDQSPTIAMENQFDRVDR